MGEKKFSLGSELILYDFLIDEDLLKTFSLLSGIRKEKTLSLGILSEEIHELIEINSFSSIDRLLDKSFKELKVSFS